MSNFSKWFETFLEEKQIPYTDWEIEANGQVHFISNEVVIEAIKGAPAHEQAGIKNTLVKIDFVNGDVNHFFKHLATGLAHNF